MNRLLLLLLMLSGEAQAVFLTGNDLLLECEAGEGRGNLTFMPFGVCSGYIKSVTDTLQVLVESGELEPRFCLSTGITGVTGSQLKKTVFQYLKKHPTELHYAAAGLVLSALKENFPCAQHRPAGTP